MEGEKDLEQKKVRKERDLRISIKSNIGKKIQEQNKRIKEEAIAKKT